MDEIIFMIKQNLKEVKYLINLYNATDIYKAKDVKNISNKSFADVKPFIEKAYAKLVDNKLVSPEILEQEEFLRKLFDLCNSGYENATEIKSLISEK